MIFSQTSSRQIKDLCAEINNVQFYKQIVWLRGGADIFLKNTQIAQTSKGITYKADYVNLETFL